MAESTVELKDIIKIWEGRAKALGLSHKKTPARYVKSQLEFFLGAHAAGVKMSNMFLTLLSVGHDSVRLEK